MLAPRHVQMIAFGGTIGTGLFVSSGATVALAGPLGALLGYLVVSVFVHGTVSSIAEVCCFKPTGSFNAMANKYVDPALSFTLGWNYFLQWGVSLSSELSASGIIMQFWFPDSPGWIWSVLFLVTLLSIHCAFGLMGFGESEFVLSAVKVVAIIAFIVAGIAIDIGAFGDPVWLQNWLVLPPVKNGVFGIFQIFLVAFFSFGGTELVGLTAADTENPKENIPKAVKQTFWRILLFYFLSIFVIGLLIRSDDPRLLIESIKMSPFTLIFQAAGLKYASHAMNFVILFAVLSAANSAIYAGSRTLCSLAEENRAPKIFAVHCSGTPYYSIFATCLFGLSSLANIWFGNGVVFIGLVTLTGVSGILTWLSIIFIHLRFRAALNVQQKSVADLHYVAPFFPWIQYLSIMIGFTILIGQALSPGMQSLSVFIGVPFFVLLWILYAKFKGSSLIPLEDIDLDNEQLEPLLTET